MLNMPQPNVSDGETMLDIATVHRFLALEEAVTHVSATDSITQTALVSFRQGFNSLLAAPDEISPKVLLTKKVPRRGYRRTTFFTHVEGHDYRFDIFEDTEKEYAVVAHDVTGQSLEQELERGVDSFGVKIFSLTAAPSTGTAYAVSTASDNLVVFVTEPHSEEVDPHATHVKTMSIVSNILDRKAIEEESEEFLKKYGPGMHVSVYSDIAEALRYMVKMRNFIDAFDEVDGETRVSRNKFRDNFVEYEVIERNNDGMCQVNAYRLDEKYQRTSLRLVSIQFDLKSKTGKIIEPYLAGNTLRKLKVDSHKEQVGKMYGRILEIGNQVAQKGNVAEDQTPYGYILDVFHALLSTIPENRKSAFFTHTPRKIVSNSPDTQSLVSVVEHYPEEDAQIYSLKDVGGPKKKGRNKIPGYRVEFIENPGPNGLVGNTVDVVLTTLDQKGDGVAERISIRFELKSGTGRFEEKSLFLKNKLLSQLS